MRILIDHCVDWRLSRSLPAHFARSAKEMGWDELSNGELPAEAAKEFDLLLTVDQNIKYQHNPACLPIAIVVLVAKTNRLADLIPLMPRFEDALPALAPRTLIEVH
jgi:hypothetical protein